MVICAKCLFKRAFGKGKPVKIEPIVRPGYEWVLNGEGEATEAISGETVIVANGKMMRRVARDDDRAGDETALEPDPYRRKWRPWVVVDDKHPGDEPYLRAFNNTPWYRKDGVYIVVGPGFSGNPYGLDDTFLELEGRIKHPDCPRDFEGIKEYLRTHDIKGIAFRRDGAIGCQILRKDFGFEWPIKEVNDAERYYNAALFRMA